MEWDKTRKEPVITDLNCPSVRLMPSDDVIALKIESNEELLSECRLGANR
jgi:hypothetical protein